MTPDGFGVFGKVPCKGDFVTDNLPAEFVQPWDAWMQQTLLHGKARMAQDWTACYLSNPVWRFAVGPGVCGPLAWTGVVASSVDGVGRIYPLTLAAAPGAGMDAPGLRRAWAHGYEMLTDLALDMVRDGPAFDRAAVRLRGLAGAHPFPVQAAPPRAPAGEPLPPGASVRVPLDGPALRDALSRAGAGFSLMWLEGWSVTPFAIVGAGLPDPAGRLTFWEAAGVPA